MEPLDVMCHRDPILDSINEGVFTVDLDWRITSFNRAAEKITGIGREDAIGQRCSEVFRTNVCQEDCVIRRVLETSAPAVDTSVILIDAWGERIPVKVSASLLRGSDGQVIGGVETFQDLRQVEQLRKELEGKHTFADIVGRSEPMARLFEVLPRIADGDSIVLLQGESGTGKELVAHAIHDLSPRRDRPFVAVNCGALPDSLLESELFGYEVGAFTDAKKRKPGRFELADGGTLFLDEIGDVSAAMQVRLLRVLEEKEFEPLGAVEPVRSDVRVVAATNRDLEKLVREGVFRGDLFYRIRVFEIEIPPLRDRRKDIPLLVDHFIEVHRRLHDSEISGLSEEAMLLLMGYDFPGNVRELRNILEHAFVLCRGEVIEPSHFPGNLARAGEVGPKRGETEMNLKAVERSLIREALCKHGGNRALAARDLGIDASTLYRKIGRLGIETPARDGRGKRSD